MPKKRKYVRKCTDCRVRMLGRGGRCDECKRIGEIVRQIHFNGRAHAELDADEERERRILLHRGRCV